MSELVGAAEIASRLGVRHGRLVHDWRRRDEAFPPPVAQLTMGNVWVWRDVEKWARRSGRL